MSTEYMRQRRRRLFNEDPHCYWCRKPLQLYAYHGKKLPHDYPTIDHLTSRFFGKRKDPKMKARTLVLACPKCNVERSKKELQANIWRTRWKSASLPKYLNWINEILRYYRKIKRNKLSLNQSK